MLAARRTLVLGSALAALAFAASPADATDGVIEINQARALAGGVTPSDTPGFPVTIDTPGSYRLTSNLTVPDADTTAIAVPSADNVTLDLNGFSILGPTVCTGSPPSLTCSPLGDGVGVNASNRSNITVANGTVRGMGSVGIFTGPNSLIKEVHVLSNGWNGIQPDGGIVIDNTVRSNKNIGINFLGSCGAISGNMVESNGSAGISTTLGTTVSGNSVRSNVIGINGGGVVSGNTVVLNVIVGLLGLSSTGYTTNVFVSNGTQVTSGVNLGHNVCGTALCP